MLLAGTSEEVVEEVGVEDVLLVVIRELVVVELKVVE